MNVPDHYTLPKCDIETLENSTIPFMKCLYSCLNRIKGDGYTESFEKTALGIQSSASTHTYLPREFTIINSFRFEGNQKPSVNVIMYMIETMDGLKGTLLKGYDNKKAHASTDEGIN
jgi:hypothetical protein